LNRVAKWNGTHWQALGDGVDDGVTGIQFDKNQGLLYVGKSGNTTLGYLVV